MHIRHLSLFTWFFPAGLVPLDILIRAIRIAFCFARSIVTWDSEIRGAQYFSFYPHDMTVLTRRNDRY